MKKARTLKRAFSLFGPFPCFTTLLRLLTCPKPQRRDRRGENKGKRKREKKKREEKKREEQQGRRSRRRRGVGEEKGGHAGQCSGAASQYLRWIPG